MDDFKRWSQNIKEHHSRDLQIDFQIESVSNLISSSESNILKLVFNF